MPTNPPAISFGAYERTGNPAMIARNVYCETVSTPAGPRMQLRARPGLASYETIGLGAIRGLAQKDGLFDGAALIVSGTGVYSMKVAGIVTTLTGTIAGTALVDIDSQFNADLESEAWIANGSALYKVLNGVVTQETFPDAGNAGATSVCCHRGFVFATEAGTDKVFYRIPGGSTWAPLDFSSAEWQPDPLVAVRSRGDQIALLGSSTFEVWTLSGNSSNPIEPFGGLNDDVGCRARATAVNCAGTLIWVDNNCGVRRWDGGEVAEISTPGLAAIIATVDATELVGGTFEIPGHRFYTLRIGEVATWVYDLTEQRWTTFSSYGLDYWSAQLFCNIGDLVLASDADSASVYEVDADRARDADHEFTAEFTAVIQGAVYPQPVANIMLVCDLGGAPVSGTGAVPQIATQWSDDLGKTFGNWRSRPLGRVGSYRVSPRWNAHGNAPAIFGRIYRFRCSEPVPRIFSEVLVNVP